MVSRESGMVFLVFSALCVAVSAFSQNNIVLFDAPEAAFTYPVAINAAGTIVGYCSREKSGPYQGFIRHARGTITLFNPPGSITTHVAGINHAGTIAGNYIDSAKVQHGFLRNARGEFTVFEVPGSMDTRVAAINDGGEITGLYFYPFGLNTFRHSGYLRYADGSLTVEVAGPWPESINPRGTIAGDNLNEGGYVIEPGGKLTQFWVPLGLTLVSGINASGTIAGYYYFFFGNDYYPYVRDPSGKITTFLTDRSCAAYGINEAGAITGGCFAGDAFVRKPSGAIQLFGAPPDSDCQSISGTAINGAGVVTGTCGSPSGRIHGFVRLP